MYYHFIFGTFITFYTYKYFCVYGETNTECPLQINQIKNIHLHHWLIHSLLLYFSYYLKNDKLKYFYMGTNVGGVLHGLTYNDWYILLK